MKRYGSDRDSLVIILMGVSGCGKTSIGNLLSSRTGLPFFDGDHFHPEANIRKMESSSPLNDADRRPWLERLSALIGELLSKHGGIMACSALKKSYRDILKNGYEQNVWFVYLKGDKELISQRLKARDNHFMPAGLLDSQFKTLQEPEHAITIEIGQTPQQIVEEIIQQIPKTNYSENS